VTVRPQPCHTPQRDPSQPWSTEDDPVRWPAESGEGRLYLLETLHIDIIEQDVHRTFTATTTRH
jgi:hypothetical protein